MFPAVGQCSQVAVFKIVVFHLRKPIAYKIDFLITGSAVNVVKRRFSMSTFKLKIGHHLHVRQNLIDIFSTYHTAFPIVVFGNRLAVSFAPKTICNFIQFLIALLKIGQSAHF